MPQPPDPRWAAALAAWTLVFVLAVIAASAYVRLGSAQGASAGGIEAARMVRKSAGAAAALGVLALAIAAPIGRATRGPLAVAAIVALAMTVTLSAVGLATGTEPPPWAAYTNQLGGVLLAGLLGWTFGRAGERVNSTPAGRVLAGTAVVFCVLQAAFGGLLATILRESPVLLWILHAATGLAVACCAAGVALVVGRARAGGPAMALGACALSVPLVGVVSALYPSSAGVRVVHALAGATLLACAAHVYGRYARDA